MLISSSQSTKVGPGFELHEISSGGSIVPVTAQTGAAPVVSSGVTVKSQTISSGERQTILKGGAAIDTIVLGGGRQWVHGSVIGTLLTGSVVGKRVEISEQIVYAGGVATRTTIGKRALQQVQGTAWATVLEGTGRQAVLSNGSAVDTTIRQGMQQIASGGSATGTVIRSAGSQVIAYGGTASGTTLAGGKQITSGTAIGTIIESRGRQVVSTQATSTTIGRGGVQEIDRGGVAVRTIVQNGGVQQVEYSGATTGTIIERGGEEILYSSGVASNVTVQSGGLLIIGSGSSVTGLKVAAGGKVIREVLTSGITSRGIVVSSGLEQVVLSGAAAIDTTVLSGGQFFFAGGKVTGLVARAGASEIAENGATVSGAKIGSGVSLSVGNRAVEKGGTIARGGYEIISQGGTATGTLVFGQQNAQAAVTGIVVGNGGLQVVHYAAFGTVLKGGEQDVSFAEHPFITVSAVGTIVENGGIQHVSPMSVARDTTVVSGGQLIDDEGFISDLTVKRGGRAIVEGGITSGTVVSSGGMLTVFAGTDVIATTLKGGTEFISGGGAVEEAIAFSGGGQLTLLAGTSISAVTLSGFNAEAGLDLASYRYGAGTKLSFTENTGKTQGTLTVSEGALTATVTLFGNYIAAGFHSAGDGAGGTAVTYSAGAAATHPDLAAHV